jgi:hypothetical protein
MLSVQSLGVSRKTLSHLAEFKFFSLEKKIQSFYTEQIIDSIKHLQSYFLLDENYFTNGSQL